MCIMPYQLQWIHFCLDIRNLIDILNEISEFLINRWGAGTIGHPCRHIVHGLDDIGVARFCFCLPARECELGPKTFQISSYSAC